MPKLGVLIIALFMNFLFRINSVLAILPINVASPLYYNFNRSGSLEESSSQFESENPYWWLNSGGRFYFSGGNGSTIQSSLPSSDAWRLLYASSNPADTDSGYHPQNIFRLLTRSKWRNFSQEMYFNIVRDNLSSSPNRNESNGLLLFNRYVNGNNTYYAGIRVDGVAVIKKKIRGTYYTMAYKKIFAGTYDRTSNPNLLPKNIWVGLKSETKNLSDGSVLISLFMDKGRTGNWTKILEAKDSGKGDGGAPIIASGYAGARTDFMDVKFDDYKNTNI